MSSSFGVERKVVLPSNLVAEFEKIAKANTDLPPYGIETCGILAGRLVSRSRCQIYRSSCESERTLFLIRDHMDLFLFV